MYKVYYMLQYQHIHLKWLLYMLGLKIIAKKLTNKYNKIYTNLNKCQ
jgi:hypothetical protein